METQDLVNKLQELALARSHLILSEHEYEQANKKLQQTIEFVDVDRLQAEIREIETEITNLMVEIKQESVKLAMTPEVLPSGIKLKKFHEVYIKDEKAAKVWAVQNAPSLVTYSYSKLKRAIENLELDWAEPYVDIRAEIASDLDEYLHLT